MHGGSTSGGAQKRIFIADAHLRSADDENFGLLLAFLDGLPETVAEIIILGDLFDFWYGYSPALRRRYAPLLDLFMRLKDRGVRFTYFEGNHDFFLGPLFAEELEARIYPDGAELTFSGRRFYLAHGDHLGEDNGGYRAWRRFVRSRLAFWLIRVLPEGLVLGIAGRLSRHSRAREVWPGEVEQQLERFRGAAAARFAAGCYAVVLAHLHVPLLERSTGEGREHVLASPGAWMDGEYTYLCEEGGRLSLETYVETRGEGLEPHPPGDRKE